MQHGAGVGRKKSGARIPSVQSGRSAPATLPILNGFDQDPTNIHRSLLAFLPGSAFRVECDVTQSKQTAARFLPGARIAHFAPPRPEQLRRRTVQRDACCHARSSIPNPLSNRELQLLEPRLTRRKQTIAPRSNRELSTTRCCGNSHAVITILTFLPGSGLQVECDVTHSKQTTAPFLPGSRIVTKRLVSPTVFHPVSSELFPTRRRISLQDGIARIRLAAGDPRMHAPVGRL
jgi:hypothetical protein